MMSFEEQVYLWGLRVVNDHEVYWHFGNVQQTEKIAEIEKN